VVSTSEKVWEEDEPYVKRLVGIQGGKAKNPKISGDELENCVPSERGLWGNQLGKPIWGVN